VRVQRLQGSFVGSEPAVGVELRGIRNDACVTCEKPQAQEHELPGSNHNALDRLLFETLDAIERHGTVQTKHFAHLLNGVHELHPNEPRAYRGYDNRQSSECYRISAGICVTRLLDVSSHTFLHLLPRAQ
jgi:hypothetical protein